VTFKEPIRKSTGPLNSTSSRAPRNTKPVFKGTRITVEHVLRELGGGTLEGDLLKAHSRLTAEHIRAALLYAAALIDLETTVTP
jgi:uncharacterized protein (DUF433 family)